MYSVTKTAALAGIGTVPVRVEADVSDGLPVFEMVGFLGSEVREARERVKTAIRNSGFTLPVKRITINLYPADVRKSGTAYDLAVALSLLSACGFVAKEDLEDVFVAGEVGLDGSVLPVRGILPMVLDAAGEKIKKCMVPYDNLAEAQLSKGIKILPVKSLKQAVAILNGEEEPPEEEESNDEEEPQENEPDFKDICGQKVLKRACEVAAAGMHNLLMIGSAGAGKSMAAKCLPSILPPMTKEERIELLRIESVAGEVDRKKALSMQRPVRSPHHTITPQGMAGGGNGVIRPGEISLAHNGVLFLDEFTEYMPSALELLRQPLEEGKITLVRVSGSYSYPSDFMLVCAMNPCQCGEFPDRNRCRCTKSQLDRYIGKLSKPILDRIDLCVEVSRMDFRELTGRKKREEGSKAIRRRVIAAQKKQLKRFQGEEFRFNSRIPSEKIEHYIPLGDKEMALMENLFRELELSARGYFKILKVARTIADLNGHEGVEIADLSEAACYRSLDKQYWER